MKKKLSTIIISLFVSLLAFAHGEDKFGPNKGFVRMPGAFHTEIVPVSKNKVKVYLLDIDWKNPSVSRSSITLTHVNKAETQANCAIESNYFLCQFPKSVNINKKGEFKLMADREGQKGNLAVYNLPMKLEKSVPPPANSEEKKMDHSGHH